MPGAAASPDALPPALDWISAVVPGTAAEALRDAGQWSLDHPTALHDRDVWYRTRFSGTGRRTLRFGGLATIAEVWLNGTPILASDNMFLTHEVDVDLAGDNELLIAFRSLDKELEVRWRVKWALAPARGQQFLGPYARCRHMLAWFPPVHAVGPWRGGEVIEQADQLRIGRPMRHTRPGDGRFTVRLDVHGKAAHVVLEGDSRGHCLDR